MQTLQTLRPAEQLALTKLKPDSTARDQLTPGQLSGEFTITVRYLLTIQPDRPDQIKAAAIPWQKLAIAALAKLNSASRSALIEAAASAPEDLYPQVKEEVEEAIGRLKESTRGLVRGSVLGSAQIMNVSREEEMVA